MVTSCRRIDKQENVTRATPVRSSSLKGSAKALRRNNKQEQIMKRNLLILAAVGAIALDSFAIAQAQGGPGRCHGQGFSLEHLTKTLSLTSDQQSKVQPILDQAKPQIIAIHKDAMQKTQAIMASTMSQIRPLLTPEQQTEFDALQKAHQDMRAAQQELHNAMKE
jgi:Spy/CpxP family protein refolding chaperone